MGQLAYYSNMGQSIAANRVNSDIKTAIIGVHGSGRDAGTYLCALTSIMVDASKERSFLRGQNKISIPKMFSWFPLGSWHQVMILHRLLLRCPIFGGMLNTQFFTPGGMVLSLFQ